MKLYKKPILAYLISDLRARKIKTTFCTQIKALIGWDIIEQLIDGDYSTGKSALGKPLVVYCYLKCAFWKADIDWAIMKWKTD